MIEDPRTVLERSGWRKAQSFSQNFFDKFYFKTANFWVYALHPKICPPPAPPSPSSLPWPCAAPIWVLPGRGGPNNASRPLVSTSPPQVFRGRSVGDLGPRTNPNWWRCFFPALCLCHLGAGLCRGRQREFRICSCCTLALPQVRRPGSPFTAGFFGRAGFFFFFPIFFFFFIFFSKRI